MGFIGIFPIILGVLIIIMTRQMRAQAEQAFK